MNFIFVQQSTVDERNQFSVDRFTGEIRTRVSLKQFSQGYFKLIIDSFNDENQTISNLTDSTTVKIWIFEPDQLVRIVVNDSPLNITDRAEFIAKLVQYLILEIFVLEIFFEMITFQKFRRFFGFERCPSTN